jgi:hypothetical protein
MADALGLVEVVLEFDIEVAGAEEGGVVAGDLGGGAVGAGLEEDGDLAGAGGGNGEQVGGVLAQVLLAQERMLAVDLLVLGSERAGGAGLTQVRTGHQAAEVGVAVVVEGEEEEPHPRWEARGGRREARGLPSRR